MEELGWVLRGVLTLGSMFSIAILALIGRLYWEFKNFKDEEGKEDNET